MADIDFISQLVDSMDKAVSQLEQAIGQNKIEEANKLKTFVFDLHKQIEDSLKG